LAELLSTLQQLQQSDPTEYKSVMSQISTNLTKAASAATSDGDTSAATQLTTLASDFKSASTSGDLPNIQDLAQALGGSSGPPPPSGSFSDSRSSSNSTSSSSTNSSNDSNSLTAKILAAFQTGASSQSDAQNPLAIILNTLSSAGVSSSNS
jgi:hypothetical protein